MSHGGRLDVGRGMEAAGSGGGSESAPRRQAGVGAFEDFEQFVVASTDRLFRIGYLMTFDAADSEDLVQETFWRLARRWDRVRELDRPEAYARRTLVNLVLDRSRRMARRRGEGATFVFEDDLPDETSLRVLRGIDDAAEFRWALALLPQHQRAAIVLRYYEDLSEAETAQALGWSLGAVKSATCRGLARLRRILGYPMPMAPMAEAAPVGGGPG